MNSNFTSTTKKFYSVIAIVFQAIWKILKSVKTILLVLFLVLSITLNAAMFMGGTIYSAAQSAFDAVTGLRSVAAQHATDMADISNDLVSERRLTRELRGEVSDLTADLALEGSAKRQLRKGILTDRRLALKLREEISDLARDLAVVHAEKAQLSEDVLKELRLKGKLRGEIGDLTADLATERLAVRQLRNEATEAVAKHTALQITRRKAVNITADGISMRAVKSASRGVGSMAGEAIPYVGIAVIIGATTLELNDLCKTLKDMQKLKEIFDPDAAPDESVTTVCAMEIPTKEVIWAKVKESPAAVWEGVKASVPDLPYLPDVDWNGVMTSIGGKASSSWEVLKDTSNKTLDGAGRTAKDIQLGVKSLAEQLSDWWG